MTKYFSKKEIIFLYLLLITSTITTAKEESNTDEAKSAINVVTVTATKRTGTAQDTGISLTAVSEEMMEKEGYDSFSDFASSVPGLAFGERGSGQTLIIMRGVNSSATQFNSDEPESKETVGVYLDETPIALNGYNPSPRLFDMERIEVLRGPQGTLFGSGSLAGTIRYISNQPEVDDFESKTGTRISSTKNGGINYEVNGMVNIPMLDNTAALRITTMGRNIDGFIDNVAPYVDPRHPLYGQGDFIDAKEFENINTDVTWGGRIQFKYKPSDDFEMIARVYSQDSIFGGYPTEDTYAADEPAPGNDPTNENLGDYKQNRLVDEKTDDQFRLYNIDIKFDFGFADLISVTSYLQHDLINNYESTDILPAIFAIPPHAFPIRSILINTTEVQDTIQELRLVSKGDEKIDWVVGVFYDRQKKTFLQSLPVVGLTSALAGFGLPILSDVFGAPAPGLAENIFESRSTFDETQIAIFGEVSWDMSEHWRLIAGFRAFDFEQDFFFGDTQGAFSAGLTINNNLSESGVNPKLSLEYRSKPGSLLYMTASQGFRLGGNNDPIPTQVCGVQNSALSFNSDSLWNYELGMKKSIGSDLQLNGAIYYIDWSDIPASEALACGFKTTQNAGEATIKGFEGDIIYAITEDLQLSGNISYTDSTFSREFSPLNIVKGSRTPLVPKWTASMNFTYYFTLAKDSTLDAYIHGSYVYQDERFNVADPTQQVSMDDYSIAKIKFGVQGDDWEASIFVNNLFDEHAVIFKDTIFLLENRDTVNRPRTIGFSISKMF